LRSARIGLFALLLSTGLPALGQSEAPEARSAIGRERDLAAVFHPAKVQQAFKQTGESLLVVSQTVSVALVIGAFLARLRSEDNGLDAVAGMMLRVSFIATVPLWMSLIGTSTELVAGQLGNQAVVGLSIEAAEEADSIQELSALQVRLSELEHQWYLESSPVLDALDSRLTPKAGLDEEWLGRGWNWVRSGRSSDVDGLGSATPNPEESERAGLLYRWVLAMGSVVQATQVAVYLAETLRLMLFHFGFALLPLMIAGLGSRSLAGTSSWAITELLALCAWPIGWALANAGTGVMLEALLGTMRNLCSSALYPKVGEESARTVAQAAPYFSWSLTGLLGVMSLGLCLWLIGSLVIVPWFAHRLCSGARNITAG